MSRRAATGITRAFPALLATSAVLGMAALLAANPIRTERNRSGYLLDDVRSPPFRMARLHPPK